MFELLTDLANRFMAAKKEEERSNYQLLDEPSFVLGKEADGFPRISYKKKLFRKVNDPSKNLELYLDTVGFVTFPNRVYIKTSNGDAVEDIMCVDFFEYDGENWRYYPAFDMDAIINNFEAEYEKHSEVLTPVIIQQIFNCL